MKKFLVDILRFLLLLLIVNVFIYLAGSKLYFGNYRHYNLHFHSFLFADSHGLPLGQSLEKKGIFNFSAESDSYTDILRKLNFLIGRTRVDTIYLTADDHELSRYREGLNNADRSVYYTTRSDYPNFYEFIKTRYLESWVMFFQPKVRLVISTFLLTKIARLFGIDKHDKAYKNKPWIELSEDEKKEYARERIGDQYASPQPSAGMEASLTNILKTCREHHITVIGIKFPVSETYLEVLSGKSYRTDSIFEDKGIRILNYRRTFIGHTDFFTDPDHLNEKGAGRLINLLVKDIQK